jgi:hypothetical protein
MALFTPEELEELRMADAEIDASFQETQKEVRSAEQRDKRIKLWRNPKKARQCELIRAWYIKNREKEQARRKAYREEHAEEIKAYQAEYRKKNRDLINAQKREFQKEYYQKNKEIINARKRAWYQDQKQKEKQHESQRSTAAGADWA